MLGVPGIADARFIIRIGIDGEIGFWNRWIAVITRPVFRVHFPGALVGGIKIKFTFAAVGIGHGDAPVKTQCAGAIANLALIGARALSIGDAANGIVAIIAITHGLVISAGHAHQTPAAIVSESGHIAIRIGDTGQAPAAVNENRFLPDGVGDFGDLARGVALDDCRGAKRIFQLHQHRRGKSTSAGDIVSFAAAIEVKYFVLVAAHVLQRGEVARFGDKRCARSCVGAAGAIGEADFYPGAVYFQIDIIMSAPDGRIDLNSGQERAAAGRSFQGSRRKLRSRIANEL